MILFRRENLISGYLYRKSQLCELAENFAVNFFTFLKHDNKSLFCWNVVKINRMRCLKGFFTQFCHFTHLPFTIYFAVGDSIDIF